MSKTRFIPLELIKHKSIKLKNDPTFSHSRLFNFVNIGFNEIATLSGCMPLVLVHDEASDVISLTCCLGFEGFDNVFYHKRQWLGHAVPLSIQCYPFNYSIDEQRVTFVEKKISLERSEFLTKLLECNGFKVLNTLISNFSITCSEFKFTEQFIVFHKGFRGQFPSYRS